jgi:TolB-like protein/tetratricopeptide (TPR) repeat protein
MQADFGGRESFKNIATPVPIWLVSPDGVKRARRRPWLAAAIVALLVVALAGGWYGWRRTPSHPVASDSKSLAVLCFSNLSEDKAMTYFADGIHEDLLTQLALLGDLKVVSRTSVLEYRDTKKNSRQIGTELGVAALLEGSVRRAGNQVRVNAQLIDARTDQHLWAKSYDRELKDIFAIQSELATEIARSLHVSLAPQEQARLAKRPTDNLQAYDLFLKHQELVNRSAGTVRSITTVKERMALLYKTVELDPRFALAWARLGAEHARAYGYDVDRTPARLAEAKFAMDRALELAPDDPQVKVEHGAYYTYALNDDALAAKTYQEILAIAPNNVDALLGLADAQGRQMVLGNRIPVLERILAIDPRNGSALVRLANSYRNFRHYDRAQALRQRMIEIGRNELEQKANYYQLEYWRTGSWESYDKWRASIAKEVGQQSFRVWDVDLQRAIGRRDFDGAVRLAGVVTDDIRGIYNSADDADRGVLRALLLRAKGDRAASMRAAQATLPLIEGELQRTPNSTAIWSVKTVAHALLGQRDAARAAYERMVAVAKSTEAPAYAELMQRKLLDMHALLGDRDAALVEMARQLKLPASHPHAMRVDVTLASLWDDPKFQAIVNDPANNAPIPFEATAAK